jgi:hypothetical protein
MIGGTIDPAGGDIVDPTPDQVLWTAIRNRTRAVSFSRYQQFVNRLLLQDEKQWLENPAREGTPEKQETPLDGEGTYRALKVATESLLRLDCAKRVEAADSVHSASPGRDAPPAVGEPMSLDDGPAFIDLIWSYWHEEGLVVQTMNAITRHLQDKPGPGDHDPLAHLNSAPLRPLNDLLWGFILDDAHRLSARRRAYEYQHQYGLALFGKTVRDVPLDTTRSGFAGAFHHLLDLCSRFFKSENDTTVLADGAPLFDALKEVKLLLAQGSHNQFGDLPWTARAEMMLQQWILARPEVHDFLGRGEVVPSSEAWMPQVDTMKRLQGWSEVPVIHFHDLAVFGEQILLSIRYGDWIGINVEDSAKNWARYWRPEIQGYLHSYRAATGVDLTKP